MTTAFYIVGETTINRIIGWLCLDHYHTWSRTDLDKCSEPVVALGYDLDKDRQRLATDMHALNVESVAQYNGPQDAPPVVYTERLPESAVRTIRAMDYWLRECRHRDAAPLFRAMAEARDRLAVLVARCSPEYNDVQAFSAYGQVG